MTEITVNGMTCTSCATHVKDALEKIPGVNAAVVSYPESRAQVMADTAVSHNQLLAAIAALGYQGSIRVGDFKDEPNLKEILDNVEDLIMQHYHCYLMERDEGGTVELYQGVVYDSKN